MRILDLGAHDGFVGTWLAQQLPGTHIDGVEANSEGVSRANRRSSEFGISGRYVQGLAEDAPEFFEKGSYDVVVSYEVIEHVKDVDHFLSVCESMCKPEGRVYLSTPNGCFGEGNNPHHLRVYRAIDLFELCRRRGIVKDMVVGHDGVSVIAYEPRPNTHPLPELAIYCGPGWEKWHPLDIAQKGLGGSETAATRLAEALSNKYTVTVYGEVDFGAWRQTCFKPHGTFDPTERRKAVISSRQAWLTDTPLNCESTLLWMHDTDYQDQITPERAEKFDAIMVLSNWHADHVKGAYPFIPEDKIVVTGNAIEPAYFKGENNPDRPPVALYSSSPDRGLDLLLSLWPEVRAKVPDAELHYCYSSVYDRIAGQNPAIGAFRDRVRALADQPGVVNLGSLSQPELAKKMQDCRVWLAPSYHTPGNVKFYETYCIGALEAAAGGCALVVGDWGALSERIEDAVNASALLEAPTEQQYIDEWVSAIVNCMTICTPQKSLSALETTWPRRAEEFDQVICHGLATARS